MKLEKEWQHKIFISVTKGLMHINNLYSLNYYIRANFYALTLSIVNKMHSEKAIEAMGLYKKIPQREFLCKDDVENMVKMKQNGKTMSQIADYYGMNYSAVHKRIDRYLKKNKL